MNCLSTSERARLIAALVEGSSLRATSRMCDVAFNTVLNFLPQIGAACADYHDVYVRNLRSRRIQCDEIWQFVGAKKKNATPEQKAAGWGDVWTWVALDADTKLCITYYVGDRGKYSACQFMQDCASRVIGKPQITTDSHAPYLKAVEDAFGGDADYAMLHKVYGAPDDFETRYSPATVIGCDMKTVSGVPDPNESPPNEGSAA